MATQNYEHLRRELVKSISDSIAFQSMKNPAFRCVDDALEILSADATSSSRDERVVALLLEAHDAIGSANLDSDTLEEIRANLDLAIDHFQPQTEKHLANS